MMGQSPLWLMFFRMSKIPPHGVFKIKAYGLLPKHARRDCLKFSVFEAAEHPDLVQVTETVTQDFFCLDGTLLCSDFVSVEQNKSFYPPFFG